MFWISMSKHDFSKFQIVPIEVLETAKAKTVFRRLTSSKNYQSTKRTQDIKIMHVSTFMVNKKRGRGVPAIFLKYVKCHLNDSGCNGGKRKSRHHMVTVSCQWLWTMIFVLP